MSQHCYLEVQITDTDVLKRAIEEIAAESREKDEFEWEASHPESYGAGSYVEFSGRLNERIRDRRKNGRKGYYSIASRSYGTDPARDLSYDMDHKEATEAVFGSEMCRIRQRYSVIALEDAARERGKKFHRVMPKQGVLPALLRRIGIKLPKNDDIKVVIEA